MFDFLDSDWFNILLQVGFVIALVYDVKKYKETQEFKYVFNIFTTIGFAIWILYPYYTSYTGWQEEQKTEMISHCSDTNNTKLCKCIDEATFKSYTHDEYMALDKKSSEYAEWLADTKEECLDESWF